MDAIRIEYEGAEVLVTEDTARDLVGRGLARVVGGELPPLAAASPEPVKPAGKAKKGK